MENLLAMPVRPIEVMLAKVVPYILVGYVQVVLILIASQQQPMFYPTNQKIVSRDLHRQTDSLGGQSCTPKQILITFWLLQGYDVVRAPCRCHLTTCTRLRPNYRDAISFEQDVAHDSDNVMGKPPSIALRPACPC
jgi:hypothetical protein